MTSHLLLPPEDILIVDADINNEDEINKMIVANSACGDWLLGKITTSDYLEALRYADIKEPVDYLSEAIWEYLH